MSAYSVLMSVYAKENPEFLQVSIESMLAQTVPADDFVLVCDGPLTDALDFVIDSFVHKYPSLFQIVRLKENQGLGKALNAGLSVCKNDLIARMDSDDFSRRDRCEKELAILEAHPETGIVGSAVCEFEKSPDNIVTVKPMPCTQEEIRKYAKIRNPFNHPSVMYRKHLVEEAGGYSDVALFEDYVLWVTMLQNGVQGYNCPEPLCRMRTDEGMYDRRGGWTYLKDMVSFRFSMLKSGFSGIFDFLYGAAGLTVVTLVPVSVRRWFYQKCLRKRKQKSVHAHQGVRNNG